MEINESIINRFSDGFVEYLDAYLDTYVPAQKDDSAISYEKFDNSKKKSPPCKIGFYNFEDLATWVKPESRIFLQNKNIKENGLRVSFIIPAEIRESMNLKIMVNGRYICDRTFSTPNERVNLLFPASEFQDDADSYDIKLLSDFSFVPKELGTYDDARLLSFLVNYIGEAD